MFPYFEKPQYFLKRVGLTSQLYIRIPNREESLCLLLF